MVILIVIFWLVQYSNSSHFASGLLPLSLLVCFWSASGLLLVCFHFLFWSDSDSGIYWYSFQKPIYIINIFCFKFGLWRQEMQKYRISEISLNNLNATFNFIFITLSFLCQIALAFSTGHQLNIPSLDKSSNVCQLTSTGQLVLLEMIKNATGILLKIPYWMCEELQNAKDWFDTKFAKLLKLK